MVWTPGWRLPNGTANSENTELYPVHPFRLVHMGASSGAALDVARNTYEFRPFPCNDGWCQDVLDAALLGLADEAHRQIVQRATTPPADGAPSFASLHPFPNSFFPFQFMTGPFVCCR